MYLLQHVQESAAPLRAAMESIHNETFSILPSHGETSLKRPETEY